MHYYSMFYYMINVIYSPPPKYIEVTVLNPLILMKVLSSLINAFFIKSWSMTALHNIKKQNLAKAITTYINKLTV